MKLVKDGKLRAQLTRLKKSLDLGFSDRVQAELESLDRTFRKLHRLRMKN